MPLQATSGAASYDAFGGGVAVAAKYIEDFFQTWLRTGTGSSTTVTTGLNASINKSLVLTKSRSAATNHKLTDTARGVTKALSSNTTGAEVTDSQGLTAFSSTGYTIGTNTDYNNSGATYVDGQWVATPKFFDVVTYTGDGTGGGRNIAHSLGSVPGVIIVKNTSSGGTRWAVYHRSLGAGKNLWLDGTDAALTDSGQFPSDPTSTVFTLGSNINGLGQTYVAYLFAHNAGGFGLSGTDNVISCGSFTTDGSGNATVNLGYEPQWLTFKSSTGVQNWLTIDTMRGWINNTSGFDAHLIPNASNAETSSVDWGEPTATGFNSRNLQASATYIYIAIRRGPNKPPMSGTQVYNAIARTGTGAAAMVTGVGFAPDVLFSRDRQSVASGLTNVVDKLRGVLPRLFTNLTDAENTAVSNCVTSFDMGGISLGADSNGAFNQAGRTYINHFFRRAPGFFDEVCYTGDGGAYAPRPHNLGVAPELIVNKIRGATGDWWVKCSAGAGSTLNLNTTAATFSSSNPIGTATTFNPAVSDGANPYVAYLFASCPGVSKVFNYTGNGSSQTINCGFTGGARFVMIKRTDSTGDWYVWDTARGIVANNDPHLSLNSTAAEVTTNDTIDTDSTGFVVNQVAATNVNVSSATYIGLAIA